MEVTNGRTQVNDTGSRCISATPDTVGAATPFPVISISEVRHETWNMDTRSTIYDIRVNYI